MIPNWLKLLGSLWPILLLISFGVLVFGIYRIFALIADREEDKQEEDRKRKELLKRLDQKIANEKLER